MNWYRQSSEFSLRSSSSRGRKRLVAATLLVCFLFLLDIMTGGRVHALTRAAGSSIWTWGATASEKIVGSGFFSSRRSLEAENASLYDQLARLQERAAAYQVLKDENDNLRAMLHIAEQGRGITAPVVSSFRASPYGTFLVGAGSADAVASGSLVLTSEDFVVGRVTDVSPREALVSELFSAGTVTDALIRGTSVSVEGQGGGNARARVAREVPVAVGDPVISPQFGGRAIGVVGEVAEDPASAYKQVYIRLPVNLTALQFVYLTK